MMVSVKTQSDIPKGQIAACMDALRGVTVEAPVAIGDVIVKDVLGTGVDVVATRNVAKISRLERIPLTGRQRSICEGSTERTYGRVPDHCSDSG